MVKKPGLRDLLKRRQRTSRATGEGSGPRPVGNYVRLDAICARQQRAHPYASGNGDPALDVCAWVTGYLDFDSANPPNWDVQHDIQKSPLWPYCSRATGIWKCPADRSTIVPSFGPFMGQRVPRVRSMSMSLWLGGFGGLMGLGDGLSSPPWRLYLKLTDLRSAPPIELITSAIPPTPTVGWD